MHERSLAPPQRGALVFAAVVAIVATLLTAGLNGRARAAKPGENPGQCQTMALNATMPTYFNAAGAVDPQFEADCFAWQEFYYLNWRAQPGSVGLPDPSAKPADFGASPAVTTVWETYHADGDVFPIAAQTHVHVHAPPGVRVFTAINKFNGDAINLHGITQATDGWLTGQNRQLTYYEVRMDNDEYQYLVGNHLAQASVQAACVRSPYGLQLPAGAGETGTNVDHDCAGRVASYGQKFGAIELKAAWIPIAAAQASRYLTARADVYAPGLPPQHDVLVGLVGLHIIHKVPNAQQFMWATFEHVDNAPDAKPAPSPTPTPARWTYDNPACNPSTDHYRCVPNMQPGTPCPAAAGAAAACDPYTAPVQVTRVTPLDMFANSVNATSWGKIRAANARSVFLNYKLVQVQWPTAGSAMTPPGARVPLSAGSPLPRLPVANTTMETYAQNLTCFRCHTYAAIAATGMKLTAHGGRLIVIPGLSGAAAPSGTPAPASDYSFLLGKGR